MSYSVISGVRLEGISACVPKTVLRNREVGKQLMGDNLEAFLRSVGVEERHVCGEQRLTSLDLSVRAARHLFDSGKFSPKDFGAVIFVTLTPDAIMPNNASYAQSLLGLPTDVAAFDINHACSGYVYGLWMAALLAANTKKRVLLLDGDTNTAYTNPLDKATGLLFGDAGTCTVVGPSSDATPWKFCFATDSSDRSALTVPGFGFRVPLSPESLALQTFPDGSQRRAVDMAMDGQKVFNYVVQAVSTLLEKFMTEEEIDLDCFDYLLLHQANGFMLRQLARKVKCPLDKVPISIDRFGNTSSASTPLNMAAMLKEKMPAGQKLRLLLAGFGAGLSTGLAHVTADSCLNAGVVEHE